jgi:hypothetical protein
VSGDESKAPVASRADAIRGRVEAAFALVASALFGLGFGFNYGVDNQVVYLLGSLRKLDSRLFANDWLVAHTTQYHPAFHFLGALLLAIDRRGWAIATGAVLAAAAGAAFCYLLVRKVARPGHALPAFLLLLTFFTLTRTHSVQVSYAFDYILQPSTLGSLGLVAAIAFFVAGRWLASGISLAAGGLFHANYAILGVGVFVLAHLLLGFSTLKQRVLRQFAPSALPLLLLAPAVIKTMGHASPAARTLFFNMRAPHHYVVLGHEKDFLPLIGFTLLGLAGAPLLSRKGGNGQRLLVIACALAGGMWLLGVLSIVGWGTATQLFPWRLAPFVEIAFQAIFAVAVIRAIAEPSAVRRLTPATLAAGMTGLALLFFAFAKDKDRWPILLVGIVSLAVVAQVVGLARRRWRLGGASIPRWASMATVFAVSLLGFGSVTRERLEKLKPESNLLRGADTMDAELYRFMRNDTPVDSVFLTPPNVEGMRYLGQRGIVVDWKASPIVPSEFMVWVDRLRDVTGHPAFRGAGDLKGYDTLDARRLEFLREKYRVDYAVVRRGREAVLQKPPVFSNSRWAVVDLRPR